ncbi:MAG TPA: AzlD domain-containing protein [Plantibacter sp.]|uniref:AzlD domain-containing protein n=1 Tax=unclassified Plantibacter TaxID=2624265 RepID=UPI002BA93622|nr:AzlD domain-containing protein [Plantibacter sp.]
MNQPMLILAGIVVLAVGTYAFRLAGPLLRTRAEVSERVEALLADAAIVLLMAVLTTTALSQDQQFAGFARVAGVLVAAVLAWRRAPFVVIVLAAAVTTALLRLAGVA